jgi:hypothetical protein
MGFLGLNLNQFCLGISAADLTGRNEFVIEVVSGGTTTSATAEIALPLAYYLNNRAKDSLDFVQAFVDAIEVALSSAFAGISFNLVWDSKGGAECAGYYYIQQTDATHTFSNFSILWTDSDSTINQYIGAFRGATLLGFSGEADSTGMVDGAGKIRINSPFQPRRLWYPLAPALRVERLKAQNVSTRLRPFDDKLTSVVYSQRGGLDRWVFYYENLAYVRAFMEGARHNYYLLGARPYQIAPNDLGCSFESSVLLDAPLTTAPLVYYESWAPAGLADASKRHSLQLYKAEELQGMDGIAKETSLANGRYNLTFSLKAKI